MTGFRRRTFLLGAAAAGAGLAACAGVPRTGQPQERATEDPINEAAVQRHRYQYGDDSSRWGELFLPERSDGGKHRAVVVVIHGGYWRSRYGAELGEPLARDLAECGLAA